MLGSLPFWEVWGQTCLASGLLYSTCSKDTFGEQRLLCEQLISAPMVTVPCGPSHARSILPVPEPPMSSQVKTDEETQGSPKDCFLPSNST